MTPKAFTGNTFVREVTTDEDTLQRCDALRLLTLGDVSEYLNRVFEGRRLRYAVTDRDDANHIRAAFERFLEGNTKV